MPSAPQAIEYPVRKPEQWDAMGRLSILEKARLFLRDRRYRKRAMDKSAVTLDLVHAASKPFGEADVVLVCVSRNAAKHVPSLLAHYRRLGVGRFAFVDDRSDDETRALLAQPDVDLFESNVTYRDVGGGLLWRDMLVERYGRDRWYVSIDSDEYLVFAGSERRTIGDLVEDLNRRRLKRAMAVMIDIYPDRPLRNAPPHRPPEAMPVEVCPLFDGDGYDVEDGPACLSVRGGPRRRIFGARMRLTKFPLIYMDKRSQFSGASSHGPFPIYRNFSAVQAVLLHYKFPADAVGDFRRNAERGMHTDGSKFYKAIVAHAAFRDDVDLRYSASRRYGGSDDLVGAGFMQDLREPAQRPERK